MNTYKVTYHKNMAVFMTETYDLDNLSRLKLFVKQRASEGWKVAVMHQLVEIKTDWFDASGGLFEN